MENWISLGCFGLVCLGWPAMWLAVGVRLGRAGFGWPALLARWWGERQP